MLTSAQYSPITIASTENMEYEVWKEYRKQGIGGSDVAAIYGISPFKTARDLYYDKIGLPEQPCNWVATEVGKKLESLVAEIFAQRHGLKVYQIKKIFAHPLYPFMQANIDYFVTLEDGSTAILECKTTHYNNRFSWFSGVPIYYKYQGWHYAAVMNIDKIYFACLYGNRESDYIDYLVKRDPKTEEDIIIHEKHFWQHNVAKHNPRHI